MQLPSNWFELSEKQTKFEKIFLIVLTNQLIYLLNVKTMRKIFFKLCMCASQKVRTLRIVIVKIILVHTVADKCF